ncbi:carbohydrate kinase family protein [Sciscionella sediminilitoris]|uniref:carbohydrate kinase family protein n=1 Tax=Sciscionella sediminilitoris TaxID=1445613 RepID=UPI0004DF54BA|nr:carbohydrate kinase [Sciscionella sp. SE31]
MIVVGGESLVDLVPTEHGRLMDPTLGGGPYNAALAAGRLGSPTAFCSRLSTDRFGAELLARLEESGVRTELLQRGPEPTTMAVVSLDEQRTASYSFYVAGTADRLFTDPGPLPAEVTALSLASFGAMVLEPGASAYEVMLHREAARGIVTMLDPNIRTALISDAGACRARFRSWLPSVGVLKLSDVDAEWLAGDQPVEEALEQWCASGPAAVVFTKGGDGIELRTPNGDRIEVPAVPVTVADTIGAGDTVHGALLAWLDKNGIQDRAALESLTAQQWSEALRYAGKAASITVSRVAAEPPYAAEMV